ncbi:MAG: hypothetical protein AAGI90_06330 [Chlamydiota bacterium]
MHVTIQTKPHPILRKRLFRAMCLACALGASLLLGSLVIGQMLLKRELGFIAMGIGAITLLLTGWYAYRYYALSSSKKRCDELIFSEKMLTYKLQGRHVLSLPINVIGKITYEEKGSRYGIAILLSVPFQEHLVMHHPDFSLKAFQKRSKAYGCDLFFPYFYEKTLQEIEPYPPIKELLSTKLPSKKSKSL